ncbi:polysaccharide biosynthesis protein [Alkaliphilus pronyensis]|uniref:Polysaccharide biosynthesis protein n=1 Tax=Alkaliphilus pronyensis TaxID=1482732 RepID=A0A6I0F1D5_9FIRM|nr:polysaccharide biosynthesis protein [Alkaliphilus pronyensis]
MKKFSFILGVILLASINFVVRSLGFIYRIILSRMIGPQAIGLYQMVFPFLMVLITLPTAGIPIAVSKLVAKENSLNNRNGIYRILLISLLIGGIISLLLTVIVSLNIDIVVNSILKNSDLHLPILWVIPAISLITFSSILRGFFYGLKDLKPAASAQILEQVTRILFVLLYLYYKNPNHPITMATIAIIGLSVGEFFGLVYLIIGFNIKKLIYRKTSLNLLGTSFLSYFKDIAYISIPITISRLISVLMQTINSILIPHRLVIAGYTSVAAIEIFGKIAGMAMPLLFLPFTVTGALVINVIPNISEQVAVNNLSDVSYKSSLAIKITLLVAIPVTLVYTVLGKELAGLIYHQKEVGVYLSIISYSTLFMCMQHTLSGILHGLGKQVITTINFLLGMLIQLYCTYFLVPNPKYGINGFFIGFILSSFVIFILHLITLYRFVPFKLSLTQSVIKPLLSSLFMILIMLFIHRGSFITSEALKGIIAFTTGGLAYIACLIITKTINIKALIDSIKG